MKIVETYIVVDRYDTFAYGLHKVYLLENGKYVMETDNILGFISEEQFKDLQKIT
jgi:hypothetical protein